MSNMPQYRLECLKLSYEIAFRLGELNPDLWHATPEATQQRKIEEVFSLANEFCKFLEGKREYFDFNDISKSDDQKEQ